MAFDFKRHLINLKGKDYLPVAARLIWFREECPEWGIVTTALEINLSPDGNRSPYAIFQAQIFNPEGRLMATGTKMEDARGFGDFLEKAETGALGRALAMCGYGTQFVGAELDTADPSGLLPESPRANLPKIPFGGDDSPRAIRGDSPRAIRGDSPRQERKAPESSEPRGNSPYTDKERADINRAAGAFALGADNLGLDVKTPDGAVDKPKVKALLTAVLAFGGIELPELFYARHYDAGMRHLSDYRNWLQAQEQKAQLSAPPTLPASAPNPTGYNAETLPMDVEKPKPLVYAEMGL